MEVILGKLGSIKKGNFKYLSKNSSITLYLIQYGNHLQRDFILHYQLQSRTHTGTCTRTHRRTYTHMHTRTHIHHFLSTLHAADKTGLYVI